VLGDRKILFTGATGQAVRPCAEALAADNEVWCVARFTDPQTKAALERVGIRTFPWTMGDGDLEGLPRDFTHVLHAAPYRGQPDYDRAAQANAVGTGMLMDHCRSAVGFVYISTFAVYAKPPTPEHPVAETDPLGGWAPYAPAYPVGKAAAEGVVRALARVLGLPSTIARLNVCYGPTGWGGLPVEFFGRVVADEPVWLPEDGSEVWCSPISADDITGFAEAMFDVAATDVTIVNLAGDQAVTVEQFMCHLAAESGREVRFERDARARQSFVSDNARRRELLGRCRVNWRDGMRDAVAAHFPEAFDRNAGPIRARSASNIWDQA
jgi:nucleoside-diphosphate-sugar epimerase